MQASPLIGSSKKKVASSIPGLIELEDLGRTSIFDIGPIPDFESTVLARARTMQTACAFAWLERDFFVTHWHQYAWTKSGQGLIVREAQVHGQPLLSGEADADVIDLELLFRVRASKKFCARVERGDVQLPEDVWPKGQLLQPGDALLRPFVEASTKRESVDRYLGYEEASTFVPQEKETLSHLYRWVSQVAVRLDNLYGNAGATLIDGKVEVALHRQAKGFVLIDGISLDELGVLYQNQHYGKNLLREWYIDTYPDWYQALQNAQREYKDDKSKWPTYPPLDTAIAKEHVRRYAYIASLLDGVLRTHF